MSTLPIRQHAHGQAHVGDVPNIRDQCVILTEQVTIVSMHASDGPGCTACDESKDSHSLGRMSALVFKGLIFLLLGWLADGLRKIRNMVYFVVLSLMQTAAGIAGLAAIAYMLLFFYEVPVPQAVKALVELILA
ncbi:uncharacterized protein STEHIDRAFT_116259 [Stereum hirsutum FP-91666 SS1]|uniref:Uncharacterized protein n=1 Tax=Stereum hirsutum (strain FP-91666) TaxID=721885 RepID=R7RWM6_STEHR|nr:uncharacterized protein STEHIDRAFT_116259 [Stereum hirsutum FP-91666 SS1]EIM79776.1 hypothetical protein STEHIDRAFT_116259 [Stereum hirsutum FP-91666 SS1]